MDCLRRTTRINLYHLSEVQNNFTGVGLQKLLRGGQRQLVDNQISASSRTSRQRAGALSRPTRKIISSHRRFIDKG